jgi:hypothetical protein
MQMTSPPAAKRAVRELRAPEHAITRRRGDRRGIDLSPARARHVTRSLTAIHSDSLYKSERKQAE